MSHVIHMSLSVRGALNWPPALLRKYREMFTDPQTGKHPTVEEIREWLMDELTQGHEVVPMCQCEGFDFNKGCPGHERATAENLCEVRSELGGAG